LVTATNRADDDARYPEGIAMEERTAETGYVDVNGLQMYYEIHGTGQPLVLLHGAFSAIGTSFGQLLPGLAENRQVVGFELQGHGHTADIDRALTIEEVTQRIAAECEQSPQIAHLLAFIGSSERGIARGE